MWSERTTYALFTVEDDSVKWFRSLLHKSIDVIGWWKKCSYKVQFVVPHTQTRQAATTHVENADSRQYIPQIQYDLYVRIKQFYHKQKRSTKIKWNHMDLQKHRYVLVIRNGRHQDRKKHHIQWQTKPKTHIKTKSSNRTTHQMRQKQSPQAS